MAGTTSFPTVIQGGIALATVAAAIVTTPPLTQYVLRTSVFTNTNTGAVNFTVSVRGIVIIKGYFIPPGRSYISPELAGMVLNPGDVISALASTGSSVNCFISGYSVV